MNRLSLFIWTPLVYIYFIGLVATVQNINNALIFGLGNILLGLVVLVLSLFFLILEQLFKQFRLPTWFWQSREYKCYIYISFFFWLLWIVDVGVCLCLGHEWWQ